MKLFYTRNWLVHFLSKQKTVSKQEQFKFDLFIYYIFYFYNNAYTINEEIEIINLQQ